MKFENVAIVGLGLIGGSLAAAFKRKKAVGHITGIDYGEVVVKGQSMGLIDRGCAPEQLDRGVAAADLVILATPISDILKWLPEVGSRAKSGALITDVGSTKVAITECAAQHLPPGIHFLGGHPMTGAEHRGVAHADAFLFENAVFVITENDVVPEDLVYGYVELLESIGAKVLFLSAHLHDKIAAVVSHLPQLLAITLMKYAAACSQQNSAYLKLAAGGFRDMTRVASSPYEIWHDILATNRDHIDGAIERFIKELENLRRLMNQSELESEFIAAAHNRLSIPTDTRGFIKPHFDVTVVVEDKPGVISSIAAILAEQNINIKDIEILKVREGDAGTLRLAFESRRNRQQAMQLLSSSGYQVSKRE
ncbi:MAG: prephenate dehydrogenase/arogenate dehydrogenase family protein [bacterium]